LRKPRASQAHLSVNLYLIGGRILVIKK